MGMYTEFHFNAKLKSDTPEEVLHILQYMLHEQPKLNTRLPDHALFKCARWDYMLVSDSSYFCAQTHSQVSVDDLINSKYLCIRCNLKNYNHEIQQFLDWIHPYLDQSPCDFLGFYRYEIHDTPTLIYYEGTVVPSYALPLTPQTL